jgi:hypothetical protein
VQRADKALRRQDTIEQRVDRAGGGIGLRHGELSQKSAF